MAVDFKGSYRLVKSENYDAYLQTAGVDLVTRRLLNTVTPTTVITVSGADWKIRTESTFKNVESTFTLGSPFQQENLDGRVLTSVATLSTDGSTLTINQNLNGQASTDTITVAGSGFTEVLGINDVIAVRSYDRV